MFNYLNIESGIYCVLNIINNKKYIGSTINIKNRIKHHLRKLKSNKHHNPRLQASFNKYGEKNFIFFILELVNTSNELLKREQYYIDKFDSKNLFNIHLITNSSLGVKRSDKTKEKIRLANLGLKHPEWRNKIKSVSQGKENHWTKKKKFTEESKKKMSSSQKNLYQNGYINPRKGKKESAEVIESKRLRACKKINQYDLNNNIIREWNSIGEAIKNGFLAKYIIECCKNKRKKYKNFIWRYKKET